MQYAYLNNKQQVDSHLITVYSFSHILRRQNPREETRSLASFITCITHMNVSDSLENICFWHFWYRNDDEDGFSPN